MTDIVERLRDPMNGPALLGIRLEAADEIERLRKEGTVELVKALLEIERLQQDLLDMRDMWKAAVETNERLRAAS